MLSDSDRLIVDLEREWWRRPGSKEQAILDRTGMTITRYTQRLNRLIDSAEALAYDPLTVRRLQRIRAGRLARSGH